MATEEGVKGMETQIARAYQRLRQRYLCQWLAVMLALPQGAATVTTAKSAAKPAANAAATAVAAVAAVAAPTAVPAFEAVAVPVVEVAEVLRRGNQDHSPG